MVQIENQQSAIYVVKIWRWEPWVPMHCNGTPTFLEESHGLEIQMNLSKIVNWHPYSYNHDEYPDSTFV